MSGTSISVISRLLFAIKKWISDHNGEHMSTNIWELLFGKLRNNEEIEKKESKNRQKRERERNAEGKRY